MDDDMKKQQNEKHLTCQTFVRFEAMNSSTYSASPVEKGRKLIPYVYLLSTPDLNYLTIENIKQCLVFN